MTAWMSVLGSLLFGSAPSFAGDGDAETIAQRSAVTVSIVVAVPEQTAAAESIITDARARGGWFALRRPQQLITRVPIADVDAHVRAAVGEGRLLERRIERRDLSRSIAETQGRLTARREVLRRYDEALARANHASVVAIERRVGQAITAIEALTGQLNVLENQAAYARVDVAFRFRDRTAVASTASPFAWVNSLSLYDLVNASQGDRGWRTRGVTVPTPPSFGRWQGRRYRATSPDGVIYRVRAEPHWPRADVGFWREAVQQHLTVAGYRVVSVSDLTVGGRAGAVVEVVSPVGPEDWTWMVAFIPVGRRIVVAEAAGEVTRFDVRRAEIRESMRDVAIRCFRARLTGHSSG